MPLPWIIQKLTRDPAAAIGLHDRGVLLPGYKADINVIDIRRAEDRAADGAATTSRAAAAA